MFTVDDVTPADGAQPVLEVLAAFCLIVRGTRDSIALAPTHTTVLVQDVPPASPGQTP